MGEVFHILIAAGGDQGSKRPSHIRLALLIALAPIGLKVKV